MRPAPGVHVVRVRRFFSIASGTFGTIHRLTGGFAGFGFAGLAGLSALFLAAPGGAAIAAAAESAGPATRRACAAYGEYLARLARPAAGTGPLRP